MPRGSVTASFLLAWLDCGGKKHSGSTGFGKEGGRGGAGRTGMMPKSTLMTFDGWFVEKGKSIGGCACHFPANSGAFNIAGRPPSRNAGARTGVGGVSNIFGILHHNSLIGSRPPPLPFHRIPQPQDLHSPPKEGGVNVRQKQKQPVFSSTRRIDINAFQI